MISTVLCMWGKGAVTLPKEWRERYATKLFLAEEDAMGTLVIKPILDHINKKPVPKKGILRKE